MSEISQSSLAARFQSDVDKIAMDFIAAYALRFGQTVEHLSSPLLRWLDFRFRFVDPQLRQVVLSDRFPKTNLPEAATAGLNHLIRLIEQGRDINPYQGRGLTLRNDTSGEKRDARTDLLWADWGILHFHLTADPIPAGQYFSKSADYLAFCIVDGNVIAFIDVLRHPDKQGFADPDLMESVHRNWPDYLNQFEVKGIVGSREENKRSQEEVHNLRNNGANSFLQFGEKVYTSPGMGVTTASTATKITIVANRVRKYVNALAEIVLEPTGQFQTDIGQRGVNEPKFSLAITPAGFAVYEEVSASAFLLPKRSDSKRDLWLAELRHLIAPDWAVANVISLKGDKPGQDSAS